MKLGLNQDCMEHYSEWMRQVVSDGANLNVVTSYPGTSDFLNFQFPAIDCSINKCYYPGLEAARTARISPLIYSMIIKSEQYLKFMLDLKPDLNFPCQCGLTPLMYAVILVCDHFW